MLLHIELMRIQVVMEHSLGLQADYEKTLRPQQDSPEQTILSFGLALILRVQNF